MSWHIHKSYTFDSDGYGADTDSPLTASEVIEDQLKKKDELEIADAVREFTEDLAARFFRTSEWDDDMWSAWSDLLREKM